MNMRNDNYRMKIGKSNKVTQNSDKIVEKLGRTFTHSELNENRGMALSDHKNGFFKNLFLKKLNHGTLHGLTHKFIEHFLNVKTEEQLSNKIEAETIFHLKCDFDTRDKFYNDVTSIGELECPYPNQQNLQLAIPFNFEPFNFLQR